MYLNEYEIYDPNQGNKKICVDITKVVCFTPVDGASTEVETISGTTHVLAVSYNRFLKDMLEMFNRMQSVYAK